MTLMTPRNPHLLAGSPSGRACRLPSQAVSATEWKPPEILLRPTWSRTSGRGVTTSGLEIERVSGELSCRGCSRTFFFTESCLTLLLVDRLARLRADDGELVVRTKNALFLRSRWVDGLVA